MMSTKSGRVEAEVQFSLFFNTTNISADSIGIGSVGISAVPIREQICSISGTFAIRIFSTSFDVFSI